ncbi:MAG: YggS family pyridoxal phosphate-dependent enzyme [Woeseiaceae bacterium]
MIGVTENLRKIRALLTQAALEAGREPQAVSLLAVSKKQPAARVMEAAAAGQREFGENQAGEGVDKIRAVADDTLIWHFIGHLQSNKSRAVAEHFDWVHSVDRLKIARRLSEQRPAELGDLNICLQVNVDEEASKAGIAADEVAELARAVASLPRLRLRGLMCLPRIREGLDAQRVPFARLRELAESLRGQGIEMDTLSMGMSADFRAAIAEGATIVRIGTAVFGPRPGEREQ